MIQRILGVFHTASQETRAAGRSWYQNARERLAHIGASYGIPEGVVAAVVAVLSPNVRWDTNLDDASAVIETFQSYLEGYVGEWSFQDCKVSTYNANKTKAFSILDAVLGHCYPCEAGLCDEDHSLIGAAERYVRGPKVSAFYRALSGDDTAVVIDSHCINAWYGKRVAGSKLRTPKGKELEGIVRGYRRAAEIVGEPATAFQATVWLRHLERIQLGRVSGYERGVR